MKDYPLLAGQVCPNLLLLQALLAGSQKFSPSFPSILSTTVGRLHFPPSPHPPHFLLSRGSPALSPSSPTLLSVILGCLTSSPPPPPSFLLYMWASCTVPSSPTLLSALVDHNQYPLLPQPSFCSTGLPALFRSFPTLLGAVVVTTTLTLQAILPVGQ